MLQCLDSAPESPPFIDVPVQSILPLLNLWRCSPGVSHPNRPREKGFQQETGISMGRYPLLSRGERIRTSGPCVPNTVLYQAELHPDGMQN